MSVRFILGRAGSGKTWTCLQEIRSEAARFPRGPLLIMLVPEQASHQTERALFCSPAGPRASLRTAVLSFRRLSAMVLGETGGTGLPVLDDLGRRMLLTAIAVEKQEELAVFGGAARRRGFASRLARTVAECSAQGVTPADLWDQYGALTGLDAQDEPGAAAEGSTLAGKLHDLAILLGRYRERISGAYVDPEEVLGLAAGRLAESALLRGARVWVDGFAGFTPVQYLLLGGIARAAEEVNVALCLDPRVVTGGGPTDAAVEGLFAPTRSTYDRLCSLAAEAGVSVSTPTLLPAAGQPIRFQQNGVLAHLEARWEAPTAFDRRPRCGGHGDWSDGGTSVGPGGPPGGSSAGRLRLVSAPDQRAEVTAAAQEMVRLCRDEGYAWRDISVLVPDMESYHDLLRTTFADHGIPCFLDRRRPVPHHPLVEFVRSAVEACEGGFAAEPVFRWLKTDLGPLGRDEVDVLENYVLEHGIRGARRWLGSEPWRLGGGHRDLGPLSGVSEELGEEGAPAAPCGDLGSCADGVLKQVNGLRERVARVLRPLYRDLSRARSRPVPAGELVSSLADLLSRAESAAAMREWRDRSLALGFPEQAQEHEEVWRQIVRLLEQAYAAFGGTPLTLSQFCASLDAGLESLTLGLVPPSLDQVVCGTVERSRQPDVRATFVLGATQGSFPSVPSEDLVFTDDEREGLAAGGVELAPTARERSFHLPYLTYIAMTRAREYLWVSWPMRRGDRESPGPAAAVARLRLLFPGLEETTAGTGGPSVPPEPPSALHLAARYLPRALSLARQGRPLDPGWVDLYEWLVGDPERRESVRSALAGLGWRNEPVPLDQGVARLLFGYPVRGSASRLERFAACPFAHFAESGLRLKPRPRQQVRAPELGSFFHAVLQAFFSDLVRNGEDLAAASDERVGEALDRALQRITPRLESQILLSSGRYRYLGRILARTVRRTVSWLCRHARRSAFRTFAVEVGFGLPGSRFPALELEGISLRGVIDRIDLAESEGSRLVRIIDYKSGAYDWHLSDVLHDLKLQLLLYLAAASAMLPDLFGGPVQVAGVFLFPIRDPLLRLDDPEEAALAEELRIKKLRPAGLVLNDERVAMLMDRMSADTGPHRLFSFRVSSAGRVAGNQAVSAEQLGMLLKYATARAQALAARIAAGDAAIAPWRRGSNRACEYCDFHALCGFDPSLPGNRYRELSSVPAKQAWRAIEEAVGREVDDR